MAKKEKENQERVTGVNHIKISDIIIVAVIVLLCLTCILPFIHLAAKSISSTAAVSGKSVYLLPKGINFEAYSAIFKDGQLVYSMGYTVVLTAIFTILGMIVTTLAAYPLSERKKYIFSDLHVYHVFWSRSDSGIFADEEFEFIGYYVGTHFASYVFTV